MDKFQEKNEIYLRKYRGQLTTQHPNLPLQPRNLPGMLGQLALLVADCANGGVDVVGAVLKGAPDFFHKTGEQREEAYAALGALADAEGGGFHVDECGRRGFGSGHVLGGVAAHVSGVVAAG